MLIGVGVTTTGWVLESLGRHYYRHHEHDGQISDHLFVADPSGGATVFEA